MGGWVGFGSSCGLFDEMVGSEVFFPLFLSFGEVGNHLGVMFVV